MALKMMATGTASASELCFSSSLPWFITMPVRLLRSCVDEVTLALTVKQNGDTREPAV